MIPMNKQDIKNFMMSSFVVMGGLCLTGCNDLEQLPHMEESAVDVYSTTEGYNAALAKIYASFVITGQNKDGNNDVSSNNGYDTMRGYINMQEMPTDEMAATWLSGDNQTGLSFMTWDENDPWISDVYYRLYYSIALANDFIAQANKSNDAKVQQYKNEARFLRALAYYMVLDLYGKGPFVDETMGIGTYTPEACLNKGLFDYIERELLDIADALPQQAEYARASSGAAYTLLAKLYLNAESYDSGSRYYDCALMCDKVIKMGYNLADDYRSLFNADNHKRTEEIIFSFAIDAQNTVSWGASTYLVCGAIGNSNNQVAADYGVTSGWGNFRTRGELTTLFENGDKRACFYTADSEQYFNGANIDDQTHGWFGTKWTNLTDEGEQASNTADGGVCTDYPLFRYADVLLMKAEAELRRGTAAADVLQYLQPIYDRAFGEGVRTLVATEVDTDFILNERARELWWESTRRTDLIRFGKFTTDKYLWEWKGGTANGTAVDASRKTYPIPAAEISANPNLK